MNVVGFIAANSEETKFRSWGQLGPTWVTDKREALILLRRSDADTLFAEDDDTWKILPVTAEEASVSVIVRWEYTSLHVRSDGANLALQRYGADGWEAWHISQTDGLGSLIIRFKRPKQ